MTRWELITNDGYIQGTIECIVLSKRSTKKMREELIDFIKTYRDELLHGDQGSGCSDHHCKVCYPYRTPLTSTTPLSDVNSVSKSEK